MHFKKLPQDLIVRRLHRGDQADICDHFLRLDGTARRARFCGAVSNEAVLAYAHKVFRPNSIVCGAFIDAQLRGLGELRGLFRGWPTTAEAAFSVETKWQNIGIGDALFERMFAMAQNRGVREIQMLCLKENGRMQTLAFKHHARLSVDQDAIAAVLHPGRPTPGSIATEIIGETIGYSHLFFG